MIILDYSKKNHDQIIQAVALALKHGKVVAYPTDTSYGLAVDTKNEKAVKKFYKIKERTTKKPVHIVVSSIAEAKKYAAWSKLASKLAKQFWPGKVSLVLPLKFQTKILKKFSAGTNTIGLRIPDNQIAIDIVKKLGRPITATSANPSAHLSGGVDSYSAEEVIQQFSKQKFQPDIIINAGKLRKTKPSTMVKINLDGSLEILRVGPVSKALILKVSKY
jgi:L-threonylcarbamoyladenylate synthase